MKKLSLIISMILIMLISISSYAKERIIVAGGSLTEMIYALGAGDEVVGVDLTSEYPKSVSKLPKIGYWKLLNIEGILSLNPTLFVTWKDSEPATIFKQVTDAKVKLLTLQRVPSDIQQLMTNIQLIAQQIGRDKEAKQLIDDINKKMTEIEKKIATQPTKPSVIFLLSMGSNMVAGKNTVADEIVSLAGGNNIAQHSGYRTYSAEGLIAENPDIIVMTSQSVDKLGGIDSLANIPGIAQTKAWKNKRIVTIDQAFILGMGPRVDKAVETLYKEFYQ